MGKNINTAVSLISKRVAVVNRFSSLYETRATRAEAVVDDQPSFANCVVGVQTDRHPRSILEALKSIEGEMGRPPSGSRGKHEARVIDADIVYGFTHKSARVERIEVNEGEYLQIPHPMAFKRDFVVVPMFELIFNDLYAFPGEVRRHFKREFARHGCHGNSSTIFGTLSTVYAAEEPRGVMKMGRGAKVVGIVNATPDSFSRDGLM